MKIRTINTIRSIVSGGLSLIGLFYFQWDVFLFVFYYWLNAIIRSVFLLRSISIFCADPFEKKEYISKHAMSGAASSFEGFVLLFIIAIFPVAYFSMNFVNYSSKAILLFVGSFLLNQISYFITTADVSLRAFVREYNYHFATLLLFLGMIGLIKYGKLPEVSASVWFFSLSLAVLKILFDIVWSVISDPETRQTENRSRI